MNKNPFILHVLTLFAIFLLTSCSGKEEVKHDETIETNTARNAVTTTAGLFHRDPMNSRPSSMLGAFVTIFLAEGGMHLENSAMRGIALQVKLAASERLNLDETYALLQELGTVLQVDVPDILNRSDNRPQTLNAYLSSLKNVSELSVKEHETLQSKEEGLREQKREQQKRVTEIDRDIRTATKEKDYARAGALQMNLGEEEAKLSEIAAEEDRTTEAIRTFKELLEIAEKRIIAIEQNREILIAGLKVIELPGIEDLGILEESKRGSRSRDRDSIFGPL